MPERMCIVTREVKDETELLRFVASPQGDIVPDLARKLPGRGVWVTLEKAKVEEAVKRGLFARGLKMPVKADHGLADQVGLVLRRQASSHLSLARKAGQAVMGFTKVEEALRKGRVALLFHAPSGADDGVRKLDRLAGTTTKVCNFLPGDDLDLAFGRANVVHAAVAEGGLAARLSFYVARYARYEGFGFGP